MSELTRVDKKLLSDIEMYGWHTLKVLEDENGPGFCYTVGFYKTFNHPEIVIIGLNPDLAHVLINNIGEDIKNGITYQSGQFYAEIIDNFNCLLLTVNKENYSEYFGYANWYYQNNNFPVLQCIYPTVKGIYPWEDEWPISIQDMQPILGDLTK
jgi:hypothetical protein